MKNIYSYFMLRAVLLKFPEHYVVMFDDDDCDETYVTFDIDDQALFGSSDIRTVKDLLDELCHVHVEKLLDSVTCNYGTYILYSVSVKENTVWLKMIPWDSV